MSQNQLEYLVMKEKYLALKNEMNLYGDLEGHGLMGKMRRKIKGKVASSSFVRGIGPIAEVVDFYEKIFKTQKITPDTVSSTLKLHNNLKIKYFEARRQIERFQTLVTGFPKPDPNVPDADLAPCFKNKNKIFKKKYPQAAYEIVFIYPYERVVNIAMQEKPVKLSKVIAASSEVKQAYKIISGYQKGAHIAKWDTFVAQALGKGPFEYTDPDFYMWKELEKMGSEVGVSLFQVGEQLTEAKKARYEGNLA